MKSHFAENNWNFYDNDVLEIPTQLTPNDSGELDVASSNQAEL
jgi:dTDP-glucose pyrophosphorylase